MRRLFILMLVAACLAVLAYAMLWPQDTEVQAGSSQDPSEVQAHQHPILLQGSGEPREPGSAGEPPQRRLSPPSSVPVIREPRAEHEAESLADLIRSASPAEKIKVKRWLEQLTALRTQAACDALLSLLRDRCQLAGNEGEWARALDSYSADERVSSTLRDVLLGAIAQRDFSFSTDARLWAVALPRRDEGMQAVAEQLLMQASLTSAPAVRCAILDALPRADTEALLRIVHDALRENSTSVSAYRLLLRTGDEASLVAAHESLRSRPPAAAMGLAPDLGAAANDAVLSRLRQLAAESAVGAGIYVSAVSGMAPDRARAEAATLAATLSRALSDSRGRTDLEALLLRKHAALAIERIAPLVASQGLAETLDAEVRAGGSTARYTSAALARVREALQR